MATDLTIKVIEKDSAPALGIAVAAYLSGGGWNKADIASIELSSNVAGTKFTCIIVHSTTPAT